MAAFQSFLSLARGVPILLGLVLSIAALAPESAAAHTRPDVVLVAATFSTAENAFAAREGRTVDETCCHAMSGSGCSPAAIVALRMLERAALRKAVVARFPVVLRDQAQWPPSLPPPIRI